MYVSRLAFASLLLSLPVVQGCSKPPATPASATTAANAPREEVVAASPSRSAKACDMVTSSEMSIILGTAVVGTPNERSGGRTECIYKPADGVSPYVEFSVTWGDGEAAMSAMGAMSKLEPGIADPYAGLGDQAASVGPVLMIRSGEDLVEVLVSGVDDVPAAARRIFDTAKPRM
jgi:hypothetical protein